MKENITNILNFEKLTRFRNSSGFLSKLPPKNSIVKIIPLEYLEQGVKVLIDGKLFIANIDEKINTKEEIAAIVKNNSPFELSLDFHSNLTNNIGQTVQQILNKLELPNNDFMQDLIYKVIESDNIIIKSKLLILADLTKFIKTKGMEFNLLVNLVWHYDKRSKNYVEDLYYNLFDESFEDICKQLYNATIEVLYSSLPQYITQKVRDSLIYIEKNNNPKTLLDKSKSIVELIVLLNKYSKAEIFGSNSGINDFIKYGTKYVFQKSILKKYDFYPDFVIVEREDKNEIVQYYIKKIYNKNNVPSYKIKFYNEKIPFKISGLLRDNLLIGAIKTDRSIFTNDDIDNFEKRLQENWSVNSDVKFADSLDEDLNIKIKSFELNKII